MAFDFTLGSFGKERNSLRSMLMQSTVQQDEGVGIPQRGPQKTALRTPVRPREKPNEHGASLRLGRDLLLHSTKDNTPQASTAVV